MQIDAVATDGVIEAMHHIDKNIKAMMWHPERSNRDQQISKQIIKEVFS